MVGNAYPYTYDNWRSDIQLAAANGIDGFILDIGADDWQRERVRDAYKAAAECGIDFKVSLFPLAFSLEMC